MSLQERLQMISASGAADQKSRIDAYKGLLSELFTSANVEDVRTFVDHVTGGDVPLVVARQVLQEVANGLTALPADAIKSLGEFALDRTANRASSFEDQTSLIREHMAAVYEAEENWAQAAKLLAGIPMDSGIRMIETVARSTNTSRLRCYSRRMRSASAETFINRAALLINEAEEDDEKRIDPRSPQAAAQGVLRENSRLEAQVPRGSHAVPPAVAADHADVWRHDRVRGRHDHVSLDGRDVRRARARRPAALTHARHALQG